MKQVQFRESTGKRTVYVTGKGVVVTLETKIGNKFYGARLTPGGRAQSQQSIGAGSRHRRRRSWGGRRISGRLEHYPLGTEPRQRGQGRHQRPRGQGPPPRPPKGSQGRARSSGYRNRCGRGAGPGPIPW